MAGEASASRRRANGGTQHGSRRYDVGVGAKLFGGLSFTRDCQSWGYNCGVGGRYGAMMTQ